MKKPNLFIVGEPKSGTTSLYYYLKDHPDVGMSSYKEPKFFAEKYKLSKDIHIIVADINKLALEKGLTIDGAPIVNTPILGLLSKSLEELSLDNLNSVIQNKMNDDLAKLNIELIEEGFKLAKTY